ncbi:MAG: hypothetical protein JW699_02550 [Chitinispirillaceae bacterium]|nr:hypothetical protein [Chitinispirillaceae bacterium]
MINEHDFYRELGSVPELPGGIYENIGRDVHRRAVFARAAMACAALFIVALGTTGFLLAQKDGAGAVSPEVVAELQTVHDYLAGGDLDEQYESYAFYDGEIQE